MSAKKVVKVPEDSVEFSEDNTEVVKKVDTKPPKNKLPFHLQKLVSTKKRKIITITAGVLVLLVCLFAIPTSRYFILSPFVKKDITLTVVDSKTKKPVTDVKIEIGGVSAQTDKDGIAKLNAVPVGNYDLKLKKQYYEEFARNYTVPVLSAPDLSTLDIIAAGRQVQVSVLNKITGDALSDVIVEASETKATTNSEGLATIILPPANESVVATLKKDGYNTIEVELKVDDTTINSYLLTPSGKVYFLSKSTGKLNVMKSNLDGTNTATVLQGTGQESDYDTVLLSSDDWKYLALSATRTDSKQRLYLIKTQSDEQSLIDQGDASFSINGWMGHNLIYTVSRNGGNYWDDKRTALKSFNAETGKITTLDETSGGGVNQYNHAYEYVSWVSILKDEVVYLKGWGLGYSNADPSKVPTLYSVKPSGDKKVVKSFPSSTVYSKLEAPQSLFIKTQANDTATSVIYKYTTGAVKETTELSNNQFDSNYKNFLGSPSGKKELWYEQRDGKNSIQIGNEKGEDVKVVGILPDYTPFGWYGENDEFILLTKNSELYISPAVKTLNDESKPLKITDYHRTRLNQGYGI